MIHAANSETSSRHKAALAVLRRRGADGATTMELFQECNDLAIHSTMAELRANGYAVSPALYVGRFGKRRVFKYILTEPRPDTDGQLVLE